MNNAVTEYKTKTLWISILLTLIAGCSGACLPGPVATPETIELPESTGQTQHLRKMNMINADKIQIAIPEVVDIDKNETVIMSVNREVTLGGEIPAIFAERAIIAAVDQGTGEVFTNMAIKLRAPRNQIPPKTSSLKGTRTEGYRLQMRERLKLPWTPATYRTAVIIRDSISNQAEFRLVSDKPASPSAGASEVFPEAGDPYPAYKAVSGSPDLPSETGLALAPEAERVPAGDMLVLHGSYRLPASRSERMRSGMPGTRAPVSREEQPKAVLSISLLVTGDDNPSPKLVQMHVPCYEVSGAAEAVATGYFSVDLNEVLPVPLEPDRYNVYGLTRTGISGPCVFYVE